MVDSWCSCDPNEASAQAACGTVGARDAVAAGIPARLLAWWTAKGLREPESVDVPPHHTAAGGNAPRSRPAGAGRRRLAHEALPNALAARTLRHRHVSSPPRERHAGVNTRRGRRAVGVNACTGLRRGQHAAALRAVRRPRLLPVTPRLRAFTPAVRRFLPLRRSQTMSGAGRGVEA